MSHKKRNWPEYNKNLVNRGRITFWIDQDLVKCPFDAQNGRGRPRFCDSFLLAALSLRSIYSLSLRSLQGFLTDLIPLLGMNCPTPHYSLFSKRMKNLTLPVLSRKKPTDLLIDASGVKVLGEGEWKVKVHGKGSRRKWIKLHVAIDERTQEVITFKVTDSNTADSKVLKELLAEAPSSVQTVFADGAYDGFPTRKLLHNLGIQGIIPPPDNATLRKEEEMASRNDFLRVWRILGNDPLAKKITKKLFNYHRRSLAETAFSRLKKLFTGRFQSQTWENLCAEAHIKFWVLNKMISI